MSKRKLLIVDDELDLLDLLKEEFESTYEVVTAANGQEGLAKFAAEKPDVILTDIRMPVMDGFEMVSQLRQRGHDGLVIFFTSKGDISSVTKAMSLKCFDFVKKPLVSVAVKRTVDEAFAFLGRDGASAPAALAAAAPPASPSAKIGYDRDEANNAFFHEIGNAVSIGLGGAEKLNQLIAVAPLSAEERAQMEKYGGRVLKALERVAAAQDEYRKIRRAA